MSSESDARVAKAIQTCLGGLQGLSNRESAMVLRALAGMNNLVVQAPAQLANRGLTRQAEEHRSKAENSGKGAPHPNLANKDPKVLELKSKLKLVQEAIRKEAKAQGLDLLPESHALVCERVDLLRKIRLFRDEAPGPTKSDLKGKMPEQSGPA